MKFFKVLLLVIGSIVALIAFVIINIGLGLFEFGKGVAEQDNQPIMQKIQTDNQEVTITIALQEAVGLRYESVALCTPAQYENDMHFKQVVLPFGFVPGYSCSNGLCKVWIETHQQAIPSYIDMYISDGAECKQQRFETQGHESVIKYEARIEFTEALLQALHITTSEYKIGATHCNEVSLWQMMGNKKALFAYDSKRDGDELTIDGVVKAVLKYE